MPRLMVISHGHPDLSAGGAERAAYAIHALVRGGAMPGWDSVFVSRVEPRDIGHDGEFGLFRGKPDEVIAFPPPCDPFFFTSADYNQLDRLIGELVEHFRPDLVHLHHFVYWGMEIFEIFARHGVPVVFTAHEFIAICNNFGQMVKTKGGLCRVSSPPECSRCFPDITSGFFFLRQETILERLRMATAVISPSRILAERLEAWSKDRLEVHVIENPRDVGAYEPIDERAEAEGPRDQAIIGYFGQINHFKGTEILLDAFELLRKRDLVSGLDAVRSELQGAQENWGTR